MNSLFGAIELNVIRNTTHSISPIYISIRDSIDPKYWSLLGTSSIPNTAAGCLTGIGFKNGYLRIVQRGSLGSAGGQIPERRRRPPIARPNCALDRSKILCLYVPGFQRQVLKYVAKCKWLPLKIFTWNPRTYTCNANFVGIFNLLRIPQQRNIASCSGFRNCKRIPQNVKGIREFCKRNPQM